MLPASGAGPEPVFQKALKDSRFGFSLTDKSSNLSGDVSNRSLQAHVIQANPTHSNIHDNGNSYQTSDSDQ